MKGPDKTNAARLLDKAGIHYELISYEVDPDDLSATHLAQSLGQDIDKIFKTIVLKGDKTGHFVCVVPGGSEINLKLAAKVSGNKKVDLIPMKELLPLTGYVRGGCSPVGMKKTFPTFFHNSATNFDNIFVSAGQRGLQFKISPAALIGYVGATLANLIDTQ